MKKILKFIVVSIIFISALSCNYIVAATNNVKITKANEFKDVKGTEWFTPNIQVALDLGITYGYDNGNFGVNDKVALNQMLAFMYRINGKDATLEENTNWYLKYMTQAIEDGIITEIDMIRAKEPISREEVARIMYAILNNTEMIKKYELTEMNEKLIFTDVGQIRQENKEAVVKLKTWGLIVGDSNTKFNPQQTITRVEVIAILNKVLLPEMRNISNISKVAEGQALIDSIRARQPEFIPDGYDDLYDNDWKCNDWFVANLPYGQDISILTDGVEFNYKKDIWNEEYSCINTPYLEKMFTIFLKSYRCTIENGNYFISGYVPDFPYGYYTALSIDFRNTNISDVDNQITYMTVGSAKNFLREEFLINQGEYFKIQVPTKIAKDGEMHVKFSYLTEGISAGKYSGILTYHFKGVNPFMNIIYPDSCKVGSNSNNEVDTIFKWDFTKMWEIIK